jgi:hypothetical protein
MSTPENVAPALFRQPRGLALFTCASFHGVPVAVVYLFWPGMQPLVLRHAQAKLSIVTMDTQWLLHSSPISSTYVELPSPPPIFQSLEGLAGLEIEATPTL